MFNWTVIGQTIFKKRYQCLSDFLKNQGVENQLNFVDVKIDDFPQALAELQKESQLKIRIESPFREVIVRQFKKLPMIVSSLGAADGLVFRDGQWWPDTTLFYSFNLLFSRYGSDLDLSGEVLVVGGGAASRFAIGAALRAGFSKVNLTTKFDDQGISLVAELKKRYFGATFEFVPQDRLVLLPGTNVLLVNTSPLTQSNDLLDELYYLNFLRNDGMIWDLVVSPGTTQLIREGEQIGIQCVRGRMIAALSDHHWYQSVTGHKISLDPLIELYEKTFSDEASPSTSFDEKSRTLA